LEDDNAGGVEDLLQAYVPRLASQSVVSYKESKLAAAAQCKHVVVVVVVENVCILLLKRFGS
jgi:hypothetical protein